MPGLGTIVNAAAIILGGLAGLLFGKLIKPRIQETIMMACGVCVIFLGIAGAMEKMLTSSADGTLGSGGFVDGFVTASLTVCIGAMAVVGSIQDGILGDHSTLFAKAVLDMVIIVVMTAGSGKGCIFSAIPVAVFQGTITALSRLLEPIMIPAALNNLSLVGSVLIFCVGVNLVWGKKIRVADMLPSLVFAVACAYLPWF